MTHFFSEIAALADEYSNLLVPDEGCEYDQTIELNLDEVGPFYNLCVSVIEEEKLVAIHCNHTNLLYVEFVDS